MVNDPFELLNQYAKVSRETFEKLSLYHDLLIKWQPKINLVSNDSLKDVWNRHFLDSLQIAPYISSNAREIWDVGTGAGFPGVVLAIAGTQNIHLIESDHKKIAFLREVLRVTKTSAHLHDIRVEEMEGKPDVIIARAMAPIKELLDVFALQVSHETICLFPKGKKYTTEMSEALEHWNFDIEIFPSVTDPEGAILKLSNIRRRPHD